LPFAAQMGKQALMDEHGIIAFVEEFAAAGFEGV
jgi:hypothetical protein